MKRRESGLLALTTLIVAFALPHGISAQGLKPYVGRWVMQRDTTTAAADTSSQAAAAAGGRQARAAGRNRGARAAAAGTATAADTTQAGANRATALNRLATAGRELNQTLSVTMRGDTLFATDSTLVATGNAIVRVDTLIADGQSRVHTGALGQALANPRAAQGGAANNRAAANPRVAQALAARANRGSGAGAAATGTGTGTRTVLMENGTNGFSVKDSTSIGNASRSITIRTTQKWSISPDGKTLTIVTLLSTDNGVTPTTRVFTR